jgi:O-antigen/teichoic acid export membrane protein
VRKVFIGNIALMIFANAIVKPLWILGIDRAVQQRVGDVAFGEYIALLNLSFLFSTILDLGLTSYNNREVARKPHLLSYYFADMLGAKFLLLVAYLLVLLCTGFFCGYSSGQIGMLFLLGMMQFVTSMLLFMRSNVNGLHQFKSDTLLSISDKLLVIIVFGIALRVPAASNIISVEGFVLVQIAASVCTIIVSVLLLRQKVNLQWPNISTAALRRRVQVAFPVAIAIFLMFLYSKLDLFLLERLHKDGALQSGLLQKSYRILDGLNMIGFMFASLLLPMFSRQLAEQKPVHEILSLSTHLLLPAALASSAFLACYSSEVMHWLYPSQNKECYEAFPYIISCFPALCLVGIFSTLITAARQMKILGGVAAIGVLITTIGNVFFAPKYGYMATAITACITLNTVGLLYLLCTIGIVHRPIILKLLLQIATLAALFAGLNLGCSHYHRPFWVALAANIALGLLAWLALGVSQFRKVVQ